MIQNIVFDMGQVLIRWQARQFTAKYGFPEADEALLIQELFQSVEWVKLDRGTISEAEVVARVCARLPRHLHGAVEEIVTSWWLRPLIPVEGMAELIRELKENGYGIYLLSNASLALRSYFSRIPGSECFDGLVVSAEEKLLKPQREIFEVLLRRFGLAPESCFFVDDLPANVEGAQNVGMEGAVFRGDVNRLRRELAAAGVRCRTETPETE